MCACVGAFWFSIDGAQVCVRVNVFVDEVDAVAHAQETTCWCMFGSRRFENRCATESECSEHHVQERIYVMADARRENPVFLRAILTGIFPPVTLLLASWSNVV